MKKKVNPRLNAMRNLKFWAWIILVVFLITPQQVMADAGDVFISHVVGNPDVIRADGPHPAAVGMRCFKGDVLDVKPGCELDITMSGKVGCRLLADTKGTLVHTNMQNMRLKVLEGNVLLNIDKLPSDSSFVVETPTAITAVRGTQFWGRVITQDPVSGKIISTFAVREGSVRITIKESSQVIELQAGQALDIVEGDPLPKVRPALAGELKAMEATSDIATSV